MTENQRLIEVCVALVNSGQANSLAQIAKKGGKTSQYFTDLKREKAKYSTSFLDKLIESYPINKAYIVKGVGDMLLNTPTQAQPKQMEIDFSSLVASNEKIADAVQIIARSNEKLTDNNTALIEMLKIEIARLSEKLDKKGVAGNATNVAPKEARKQK